MELASFRDSPAFVLRHTAPPSGRSMAKGQPDSRDGKMPYQKLLEVMAHMALATESVPGCVGQ